MHDSMRTNDPFAPGWQQGFLLLPALIALLTGVEGALAADAFPAVTNLAQARRVGNTADAQGHFVQLEGTVLWVDAVAGRLVLRDQSGSDELNANWGGTPVMPGQLVRLAGRGAVATLGSAIQLGVHGPVVNNDGVHGVIEKTGAVFLSAGRQPIRVEWFNAVAGAALEVWFSGPEVPLQRIPATALWREETRGPGAPHWVNGLDYRTVTVAGEALPDFALAASLKSGACDDFDPAIMAQAEHVGVQFNGFIEIPSDGIYSFQLRSDDGSRLFVGRPTLQLERLGTNALPVPVSLVAGQRLREHEDSLWASVEGVVQLTAPAGAGLRLELGTGPARLPVEVADATGVAADALLLRKVRITGFCQAAQTLDGQRVPGVLLTPGRAQIEILPEPDDLTATTATNTNALPVLRTAAQVHRLKREESQRGYPVMLRGTVTCVLPEHQAVTLQDGTRGIYVVDVSTNSAAPLRVGDLLEVEGVTDPGLFAPVVNATRLTRLGAGQLPVPVQPMWDQLMSGSLDAQYVELPGVVTAVHSNSVSLLTRGGVVQLELRVIGLEPAEFRRFENALVRVRGCLLALWDYQTHQFRAGAARIYGADVLVDQPAPEDLFSTPAKTAAELRLFDPQGGLFRRVKVAGQVMHVDGPELFVADGGTGLRCILKASTNDLLAGELVEVVGFPQLLGLAAPVLREAVLRRTGESPLPPPPRLIAADFNDAQRDATRVRIEGLLVERRRTEFGWLLEIQSGVRTFAARCARAETPPDLAIGSRLELTGVYAALGGQRMAGKETGAFELLLPSAEAVRVLARPPWWTLERLLMIVGVLATVLILAMLWITQLHRQVEQRGAALEKEIRARQHVEQQRVLEQERARVARDLHDELGSDLTEVGMLLARAQSAATLPERRERYLEQTGAKARQMVTALDEIVWAMNPRHDSLGSLTSYFCLHADRFLGLAGVTWRLEEAVGAPDLAVDSRRRHQLFLAFKEALTNVVRHAQATEVRFRLAVTAGEVQLTVTDNGRGLPATLPGEGMDGVGNLRARCEKLGGRFEIESAPGRGTTVRFGVPVN
jgi:signal transduction histidine kinase